MPYIALLLMLVAGPASGREEPLRVAVAANFRATLEQINAGFAAQGGYPVVLSSGSTGTLFNQIMHGAPFDLFLAADRDAPARLAAARAGTGAPFCYARGRLVLSGGDGSLDQLADPGLSLAIANPVTAPYGAAAMSVLRREEFRSGANRKLVRGNNVAQAYQFRDSGMVDLALLPQALAPAGTPVPGDWHDTLDQYAIALKPTDANPGLLAYLNWIRSDTVRNLITEAGYEPCP